MLTRRAVKSAAPLPLPAVPPDVGSSRPSETGAPSRETFARIAVLAEAVAQNLRQLADLARLASGAVPFSPKALAWPHVEAAPPPLLYLAIEGARIGRRSGVLANGSRVELQDSVFVALLRFARANHRAAGSWSNERRPRARKEHLARLAPAVRVSRALAGGGAVSRGGPARAVPIEPGRGGRANRPGGPRDAPGRHREEPGGYLEHVMGERFHVARGVCDVIPFGRSQRISGSTQSVLGRTRYGSRSTQCRIGMHPIRIGHHPIRIESDPIRH